VCVIGACTSGDAGTSVDAEASTGDATTTDAPTEHPPSTTDDPGTTTTSGSDTIPGATTTPRDDTSQGTTTASTDRGTSTQPSSTDEDGSESSTGVPPMNATCRDDHRVVAFVANWQACPTAEQLAAYSHVVVAFAVTYTWTESGNLCDPECTLQPVEGCSGTSLAALVETLHAQGQEVLVSFGGAGMGGIWEGTCGEMVKCWDACVGRADAVADELTELVATHGLDGIDIDYEYCLDTPEYRDFLELLTLGLRERLDRTFPGEHKRITHAPMDREVDAGEPYYEILRRIAPAIDFLMPQYYNGGDSPFTDEGLARIHDHYATLVQEIFAGDASRVTVGFCIEPGCQPVATQPAAVEVIQEFDARYPDHGGVFFWAHPDDVDAWFSAPFRAHYDATVCP